MTDVLIGVVTWYAAAQGAPLYCGPTYDAGEAWLALPVEMYQSGEAACGDVFAVRTEGELLYLPALDAGGFGDYCVEWGEECLDIVADLPRHAFPEDGRSARAIIVNSQPWREQMREVK